MRQEASRRWRAASRAAASFLSSKWIACCGGRAGSWRRRLILRTGTPGSSRRTDRWVIDGLGRQDSIAERLARSTEIILIDMPLWVHFWLAAERQIAWAQGRLADLPAGAAEMPPTRELFRTMSEVDRGWLPDIRSMCAEAELEGKAVTRLGSVDEIDAFVRGI
jgi:hypothetical protein